MLFLCSFYIYRQILLCILTGIINYQLIDITLVGNLCKEIHAGGKIMPGAHKTGISLLLQNLSCFLRPSNSISHDFYTINAALPCLLFP